MVTTWSRLTRAGLTVAPALTWVIYPNRRQRSSCTPQVCLDKAGQLGCAVHDVVLWLPNHGALAHLRQAQAILRLEKRHGTERLNTACQMSLRSDAAYYRTVGRILDKGLDRFDRQNEPDRSAQVGAYLHGSRVFSINTSFEED